VADAVQASLADLHRSGLLPEDVQVAPWTIQSVYVRNALNNATLRRR
jgi:hypothetical protein